MTKPHETGADAGYNYLASAPLFAMRKPPGMIHVPGRVDALAGFEVYSSGVGKEVVENSIIERFDEV